MLKKFPEEDFIKLHAVQNLFAPSFVVLHMYISTLLLASSHAMLDGLIEPESHTDHSPAHSIGNVHSPTNEVQQEISTEDRTSLPSEQTVAKEAHIQSSILEDIGNAATIFSQDPILTNMRTRRVNAPSLNRSESSRYPVYLLSLRNKGRIVAKAKLVTTNGKQEIGGSMLGKEYVGIYVEGFENVDSRNKGDELTPRPIFKIRTLIDAIGYTIPWPRSHVKKATSSNLKQPSDVTFQGRSEAAMERGAGMGNKA
uniref:Transposase Tnp1/En/Spm-like domain-containing protein n=1 Tax=Setaria viridis TaxID=4556 RepID=A0A4U6TEB0_SETVI|nr:hypothetical protein SEVIR_8G036000v2 [Setaria viridis]